MTSASPSPRHERTRQVLLSSALCAGLAVLVAFIGTSSSTASGILPASNPRGNVAPSPDFLSSGTCSQLGSAYRCSNPCVTGALQFPLITGAPGCTDYVLAAINTARRREGLRPMLLPTNWYSLSIAEQLFVVADLERVARGLPPYLGLNVHLTADAQRAAVHDTDPTIAAGFPIGTDKEGYDGMGGAWSSGFSVLGADYFWMYDDGWGNGGVTYNLACTSSAAAGCWAHRDELLGFDPRYNPGVGLRCRTCEMGTGYAVTHGYASFVDLVELPKGRAPAMTFTWARNVKPYLVARPPVKDRTVVHHLNRAALARRNSRLHPWRRVGPTSGASPCLVSRRHHPLGRVGCRRAPTHKTLTVGRHRAGTTP
ncbi:MAG TPA: hypothetical protein VKT18_04480 [Acidimicrobiales bacterium]|nr:hypothetical protein [Acidimicrobiales bacterium]